MSAKNVLTMLIGGLLFICGCNQPEETGEKKMGITKEIYGTAPDGKQVDLYTLTNANDLQAKIMNFGGVITELHVPDRNGKFADMQLGCATFEQYLTDSPHFGALIGRFGNRIGKAKFTLNGVEYKLAANNGQNHLHGGKVGFDKVVWDAEPIEKPDGPALKLTYLSKHTEEGYPGNLSVTVTYQLTNNNELSILYEAETDKPTIVNLTNHSYFNLAGHDSGDILGHEIMINANQYTPVDDELIPTGEIASVTGTPLDFTIPMPIGARIDKTKGGYDHNFVLNSTNGSLALAASVYEPVTGRVMEVYTTQPGIQFYSGNFMKGGNKQKDGAVYNKHQAFCLETQHFPDSPNKPQFPSVTLNAGQKYEQLTIYKFSTR